MRPHSFPVPLFDLPKMSFSASKFVFPRMDLHIQLSSQVENIRSRSIRTGRADIQSASAGRRHWPSRNEYQVATPLQAEFTKVPIRSTCPRSLGSRSSFMDYTLPTTLQSHCTIHCSLLSTLCSLRVILTTQSHGDRLKAGRVLSSTTAARSLVDTFTDRGESL